MFVQYPTAADPENANKVVPNTELAATLLMRRIAQTRRSRSTRPARPQHQAGAEGEGEGRGRGTRRVAGLVRVADPTTKTPTAVIAGLRGQTAAQQTCSIARHPSPASPG